MKYDNDKFADIQSVCNFLGEELCHALPTFNALKGNDNSSYRFRVGKVRIFHKLHKDPKKCKSIKALEIDHL